MLLNRHMHGSELPWPPQKSLEMADLKPCKEGTGCSGEIFQSKEGAEDSWALPFERRMSPQLDYGDGVGRLSLTLMPLLLLLPQPFQIISPHVTKV